MAGQNKLGKKKQSLYEMTKQKTEIIHYHQINQNVNNCYCQHQTNKLVSSQHNQHNHSDFINRSGSQVTLLSELSGIIYLKDNRVNFTSTLNIGNFSMFFVKAVTSITC